MLTTRVQTLFEKEDYRILKETAAERDSSVGELLRFAAKRLYIEPKIKAQSNRQKVVEEIRKLQQEVGVSRGINYRELIEDGRKW